jgi:hypothetical protein
MKFLKSCQSDTCHFTEDQVPDAVIKKSTKRDIGHLLGLTDATKYLFNQVNEIKGDKFVLQIMMKSNCINR